jgi:hypothetical protein
MRLLNALRAFVFSVGAAYLIFSQDHSAAVGLMVLQAVSSAIVVIGIIIFLTTKLRASDLVIPTALAALVSSMTLILGNQDELFTLKTLVILFTLSLAIHEFVLAMKANSGDAIELRISSGLGSLIGLLFLLAPLDDLNAVGFFSAYLALSAVQRAVWAAGPAKGKKKSNGKK